jgi:hypothetical protein
MSETRIRNEGNLEASVQKHKYTDCNLLGCHGIVRSSETMTTYKTTVHHSPEYHNPHFHRRENIKFSSFVTRMQDKSLKAAKNSFDDVVKFIIYERQKQKFNSWRS